MSIGDTGPDPADPNAGGERQPTEEELRAAYEAEVKKIRVEQIVLEQVVTLINLGMRRTGLTPGTEDERDLAQVRLAIESIRVQLPLIEQAAPAQVGPIRDALSQLQMAFVRLGGVAAGETQAPGSAGAPQPGQGGPPPPGQPSSAPAGPGTGEPASGEQGPAQRSGRLWIPGQ
jgi:hypothetical protein